MNEARQPLLPEGWQLIPAGILEELGPVTTKSEDEPNLAVTVETPKVAKEIGKKAVKPPETDEPLSVEDEEEVVILGPSRKLNKDSAEPSISGIRVTDNRSPEQGEVRAANAIRSFMKINGSRLVAEAPLINRLTGAGLTESKARDYIEQACAAGKLIKDGKFYKSNW